MDVYSLSHYGNENSGRYPRGSGDDPEQRNKSFLGYVKDLRKQGMSDVDICEGLGINTKQLRAQVSIANAELKKINYDRAVTLKEKGYSNMAIGRELGKNESSIRSLLDPMVQERSDQAMVTANMLKESVAKKEYIDVGIGVERFLGVNRTKLNTALIMLEEEGYNVHKFSIQQVGTDKKTNMKVLTGPDVTYSEILKNKDKISGVTEYSEDGGRSSLGLEPPKTINSKRIQIRYAEEGGIDKDGVIELRRGVDDISLGNSKYAQVRISVDDTHYLKGMAMYSDDLPKGVDIMFNTNKKKDTAKLDVLKVMAADMNDPKAKEIKMLDISKEEQAKLIKNGVKDGSIKTDPDNPFGAVVKQKHYEDKNGKQLSALNIVNEEGEWHDKWSKSLSSQMLSKQSDSLATKQLAVTYNTKREEYDEIMSLTNPAIKKRLLESFSDDCDSSAVHLKAAALPRSGWHVILPVPTMKETEVYAPAYRDGEKVVLIRYPHGGIFEIPELTVNNRQPNAKKALGAAKDAVGIHPKVAEKLSGADFDGDAVLVLPNDKRLIKTSASLKGLVGFDPKTEYKAYEGMPQISPKMKQTQMGYASNLITDMTIKGANTDEIARAVKHSMVVIDSEKHHLDYKKSALKNGIAELKTRYQGGPRSGASTLISRASSDLRVAHRQEGKQVTDPVTGKTKRMYIDPETGKKLYEYTGESYNVSKTLKDGTVKTTIVARTTKTTKMAEQEDAHTLSSGTTIEKVYAEHSNKLKALANESRKEYISIQPTPYSPSAKKTYAAEVSSLNASLNIALKNAPLERQAQLLANTIVSAKKASNPDMDNADIKRIKGQALIEARTRTGAAKQRVEISDREWEAIQSGAISNNALSKILNNTDLDKIKALATPRTSIAVSDAKQAKAKVLLAAGRTQAEVADALGISTNTLSKIID